MAPSDRSSSKLRLAPALVALACALALGPALQTGLGVAADSTTACDTGSGCVLLFAHIRAFRDASVVERRARWDGREDIEERWAHDACAGLQVEPDDVLDRIHLPDIERQ